MDAKIPPHATKVFKGELFEIWQWNQEMFDGSTKVFELAKRVDSVVVLPILPNGNILLERQMQPNNTQEYISLPGGMIDEGEDSLAAGKRELLEETGYEALGDIVHWFTVPPRFRVQRESFVYIAFDVQKTSVQNLDRGGEKIEVFEATFEEFTKIIQQDNFQQREVAWKIALALLDEDKMKELKKLLRM